ncbi:MAG: PAS domain S-box protein [Prolixibacteraceae bacterium]|nr:PAS domain S-box protein [Prolixibacteraceae bacterium]
MQSVASDLLLLITKLSQINDQQRLIQQFIASTQTIFSDRTLRWISNEEIQPGQTILVATKHKNYGFIGINESISNHQHLYPLFQNAVQLLALLIEKLEQNELLNNPKAHLQHLVDQQTNHLIQKQDELNEMNEEFATINEELIETNQLMGKVNSQLQDEIIEREKVEKKLHDSDKFFNHSNDMLCIAGFDGYFKVLNPAWSKTLGWSTDELLSKPWIHYVHPDDVESTNNVKSTIVDGQELYQFENRYLCKNGSVKWLSWSSFPYPQEEIMFGVARDVTQIKNTEEKFRSIVHSSPNGIYFYHLSDTDQLIFAGANPAADKIIGFDHRLLLGKKLQEAFPNLTDTFVPELYTKIAKGEEPTTTFEIEYQDSKATGFYEVTVYSTGNNTIAVEFIEISERKKAERIIKASEEKYRTLIDFAPDAFFQGDNEGNFITINDKACELTGFSKEELLAKNMSFLFSDSELNKSPLRYDLLIKGETLTNERQLTRKDGKTIFVEMNSKMLPDGSFQSFIRDISERKSTEEILRESEKLFSNIFYNSPVAIIMTSRGEGKVIDANNTFLRNLEFSRDEVVGKSIGDLGIFNDPSIREKLIETLLKNGFVSDFECSFRSKTGKITTGLLSMSLILYKGMPHQLTTVIDITERKLAETKIQDSERLLTESQRASGIGSYTLYIQEGTWVGSKVLDEMFELSTADDHSIAGWLAVIHPEDQQMMGEYFANEVIGKKQRFDKIYRIISRKKKQTRWVHGIGELEFDDQGKPIRMIGTIQDITYRVNAEERLRILTRAIDQSPDSIVITNKKAEIEYVNPVIEKLSGYSKEELIGKNPRIFSSGKTPKEVYKQLWDSITAGKVWQGEFHNKKKNGELYWESATISPVINNEGKISHYLAIREDITEQKKMTRELIEAKEHAEESDRLKSSFLANMSHEIRTPMNSIMGFASLLPEEESKELINQYANIIVQNAEQLVSLIDSIVLYSKLQTGLFVYHPKRFSVNDLLNDIQQSFNLPIYQKDVLLKFEHNYSATKTIYTDYDKLRQIITNLITNAFKYTHKGEVMVACNFENELYEFMVKDTGIGIPENDVEHVFERFYRGSNVNEAIVRGTGLGLSIVKELVVMLGGKIWVESEVGRGSTFYITLPNNLL